MHTATTTQLAAFLRTTADGLQAAGDLGGFAGLRLYLSIGADSYTSGAPEHERVAVIHALTHHLGLPAGDRTRAGSLWEYASQHAAGGTVLRVDADIDAPPQRCTCGQTCTHNTTSTTRAA